MGLNQERAAQAAAPSRGSSTTRSKGKTIQHAYEELWSTGKIDKPTWVKFAAGAAVSAENAASAADFADDLYMEMMDREQLAVPRK